MKSEIIVSAIKLFDNEPRSLVICFNTQYVCYAAKQVIPFDIISDKVTDADGVAHETLSIRYNVGGPFGPRPSIEIDSLEAFKNVVNKLCRQIIPPCWHASGPSLSLLKLNILRGEYMEKHWANWDLADAVVVGSLQNEINKIVDAFPFSNLHEVSFVFDESCVRLVGELFDHVAKEQKELDSKYRFVTKSL